MKKLLGSHWTDNAARTTAVLAVLAAMASSQYAQQFSRAILAQSEATDEWNHYSAKSIKRHLTNNQVDTLKALLLANPQLSSQMGPLLAAATADAARYEKEAKDLQKSAEQIDSTKKKNQRQGDRFQYAFVILQVGVVLCTIASSSKQKSLWLLSVILGVLGLLVLADGFLLVV